MKARIFFTNFWEREETQKIHQGSRYLYLYLYTSWRNTLTGVFYLPTRVISFETGIESTEKIGQFKEELESVRYAHFFNDWVYLPKAQQLGGYFSQTMEKAILKEISEIPTDVLNHFESLGYEIPYQPPMDGTRKQKAENRAYKEENRDTDNDEINIEDIPF